MTRHAKPASLAAEIMPAVPAGLVAVEVTAPDFVSNGEGGYFAVGSVIPVSSAQAASLRLQGCAK